MKNLNNRVKFNNIKFYKNLFMLLFCVAVFHALDAATNNNSNQSVLWIAAFFLIWNINICTKRESAARIEFLEKTIKEVLNENAHLADGENCTLIKLKKAIKQVV